MTVKPMISNLLLGVTGSVGVLVVPDYIRHLRESVAENVHVMMSHSAKKFVTPYTLRLYSGNYVFTDSFDISDDVRVPHIELTR
ncbi:MAG: flavoprotein, partial [Thermoproteota archaeon]